MNQTNTIGTGIFLTSSFTGLEYEEAFEESANIENNSQIMLPPFAQVRIKSQFSSPPPPLILCCVVFSRWLVN